jgi:hypothetical protein
MNKILSYIFFIIGIFIGSIFYTLASFYFKYAEKYNIKFIYIFLVSILFGICSYSIKIPVYYFFGKNMNVLLLNIIFLVLSFIVVMLYSKFILNEKIPFYSILIIVIILLLIILNHILDEIYK